MPLSLDGSGSIGGLSVGGLPDGSVSNGDLATNAVSTSKILDGAVTTPKLGSNEQSGLCKAWVNFDGTGTVAIRASYNVSSITDNGAGNYNINMTTALADANYCVAMSCWSSNTAMYIMGSQVHEFTNTSSAFRVTVSNSTALGSDNGGGCTDVPHVFVSVFR